MTAPTATETLAAIDEARDVFDVVGKSGHALAMRRLRRLVETICADGEATFAAAMGANFHSDVTGAGE